MTSKNIIYWKGIRAGFGLMFQVPKKGNIYVLDLREDKKSVIHTFFCLVPLDIVLLDSNLNITEEFYNIRPFKVLYPKKHFRFVIEGRKITYEDIREVKNFLLNFL